MQEQGRACWYQARPHFGAYRGTGEEEAMTCKHDVSARITPPDENGMQIETCGSCGAELGRYSVNG